MMGPQRSPWTSSSTSATRYFSTLGNGDSLLPYQAVVAQLTGVLDVGQPEHHLLQSFERVEAEMPESGMPEPWLLCAPHRQAYWLLHL
jgi:hypothetical protein